MTEEKKLAELRKIAEDMAATLDTAQLTLASDPDNVSIEVRELINTVLKRYHEVEKKLCA